MKKLQVTIAAFLLATTISFAQPAATQNEKHSGKHHKKMEMQELNLTEDQKAQMKVANEDFKAQMKAIGSDENQTVKQQRDKRAALAKAHKAKVESLLTPEQKTKMAELKATAKQRHSEMSAQHMDKMKQELNLSDDQVNQLKKSDEAMKSKLENIQNNTSLDETAKRQQLMALRGERKATMDKVLTAEQKEKWKGMHKQHSDKMKKHGGKKVKQATV